MHLNHALPALVVDDFVSMTSITARVLNAMGFCTVETAQTGAKALEMAREKEYGLVVCDLHMKPMSGMDLLRQMKSDSRTASIPFIVLSGDPMDAVVSGAKQAGACGFVLKPPSPGLLRERLEDAIRTAA